MMTVMRMDGPFGVDVTGIRLDRDIEPALVRQLADLLFENRIVRIRGQSLGKEQYLRFARHMGEPIKFFIPSHLDQQFPELIQISNAPDTPARSRNGAGFWHTDGSYEAVPPSTTMLFALEAPREGGETLFIDLVAAYDSLPEAVRARIDGLSVRHVLVGGKRAAEETQIDQNDLAEHTLAKRAAAAPVHPLVLSHPVTGRKGLYAPSGSPRHIVGMADDEAEALLDFLKTHVLQERFQQQAKCEVGDILIWDNLSTLHRATPTEYTLEEGKRRVLLRFSATGLPPVYGAIAPPFGAATAARQSSSYA